MTIFQIDRDEDMDRAYIPVSEDWEIQTKGEGSSFRIAKRDNSGVRYVVMEEWLHDPIEEMARSVNALLQKQANRIEELEKSLELSK